MGHAREKNVGWRIDYFITSKDIEKNIKEATIYPDIFGSDHCPVGLEIEIIRRKINMNEIKKNLSKWMYWFLLAVSVIISI